MCGAIRYAHGPASRRKIVPAGCWFLKVVAHSTGVVLSGPPCAPGIYFRKAAVLIDCGFFMPAFCSVSANIRRPGNRDIPTVSGRSNSRRDCRSNNLCCREKETYSVVIGRDPLQKISCNLVPVGLVKHFVPAVSIDLQGDMIVSGAFVVFGQSAHAAFAADRVHLPAHD
jgi:hypothetical protein